MCVCACLSACFEEIVYPVLWLHVHDHVLVLRKKFFVKQECHGSGPQSRVRKKKVKTGICFLYCQRMLHPVWWVGGEGGGQSDFSHGKFQSFSPRKANAADTCYPAYSNFQYWWNSKRRLPGPCFSIVVGSIMCAYSPVAHRTSIFVGLSQRTRH